MLIRLFKTRTILRSLCLSIFALTGLMLPASAFAQTPTLGINDINVVEADAIQINAVFTVTLSAASQQTVSVLASTQQGTATDNADFVAGSIPLTFNPGQVTKTVTVFVQGDSIVEGNEQFFLNLSNPVNATIADAQGVATIFDNESLTLVTEAGSQRAIALDSVFLTRDPLPIHNEFNFSSDDLTRISLFALGLKLAAGETVTATAEDSQGTVRDLTVEFVGKPPFDQGFTQVILKLTDQITTTGDLKIKITTPGQTSNTVLVAVKPQ